ncbi:Lecithin:cholesterol/ phospholipid:diacylglycerol acyltransferase like protein, partial [Aduncisulcus paluster]
MKRLKPIILVPGYLESSLIAVNQLDARVLPIFPRFFYSDFYASNYLTKPILSSSGYPWYSKKTDGPDKTQILEDEFEIRGITENAGMEGVKASFFSQNKWSGVFDELISQLCDLGYSPGTSLFAFNYDYRRSFDDDVIINDFTEFLRVVKSINNNERIALISHGTGGLFVKSYLLKHPEARFSVSDWVAASCPFYGAGLTPLNSCIFNETNVSAPNERITSLSAANERALFFTSSSFLSLLPSALIMQMVSQITAKPLSRQLFSVPMNISIRDVKVTRSSPSSGEDIIGSGETKKDQPEKSSFFSGIFSPSIKKPKPQRTVITFTTNVFEKIEPTADSSTIKKVPGSKPIEGTPTSSIAIAHLVGDISVTDSTLSTDSYPSLASTAAPIEGSSALSSSSSPISTLASSPSSSSPVDSLGGTEKGMGVSKPMPWKPKKQYTHSLATLMELSHAHLCLCQNIPSFHLSGRTSEDTQRAGDIHRADDSVSGGAIKESTTYRTSDKDKDVPPVSNKGEDIKEETLGESIKSSDKDTHHDATTKSSPMKSLSNSLSLPFLCAWTQNELLSTYELMCAPLPSCEKKARPYTLFSSARSHSGRRKSVPNELLSTYELMCAPLPSCEKKARPYTLFSSARSHSGRRKSVPVDLSTASTESYQSSSLCGAGVFGYYSMGSPSSSKDDTGPDTLMADTEKDIPHPAPIESTQGFTSPSVSSNASSVSSSLFSPVSMSLPQSYPSYRSSSVPPPLSIHVIGGTHTNTPWHMNINAHDSSVVCSEHNIISCEQHRKGKGREERRMMEQRDNGIKKLLFGCVSTNECTGCQCYQEFKCPPSSSSSSSGSPGSSGSSGSSRILSNSSSSTSVSSSSPLPASYTHISGDGIIPDFSSLCVSESVTGRLPLHGVKFADTLSHPSAIMFIEQQVLQLEEELKCVSEIEKMREKREKEKDEQRRKEDMERWEKREQEIDEYYQQEQLRIEREEYDRTSAILSQVSPPSHPSQAAPGDNVSATSVETISYMPKVDGFEEYVILDSVKVPKQEAERALQLDLHPLHTSSSSSQISKTASIDSDGRKAQQESGKDDSQPGDGRPRTYSCGYDKELYSSYQSIPLAPKEHAFKSLDEKRKTTQTQTNVSSNVQKTIPEGSQKTQTQAQEYPQQSKQTSVSVPRTPCPPNYPTTPSASSPMYPDSSPMSPLTPFYAGSFSTNPIYQYPKNSPYLKLDPSPFPALLSLTPASIAAGRRNNAARKRPVILIPGVGGSILKCRDMRFGKEQEIYSELKLKRKSLHSTDSDHFDPDKIVPKEYDVIDPADDIPCDIDDIKPHSSEDLGKKDAKESISKKKERPSISKDVLSGTSTRITPSISDSGSEVAFSGTSGTPFTANQTSPSSKQQQCGEEQQGNDTDDDSIIDTESMQLGVSSESKDCERDDDVQSATETTKTPTPKNTDSKKIPADFIVWPNFIGHTAIVEKYAWGNYNPDTRFYEHYLYPDHIIVYPARHNHGLYGIETLLPDLPILGGMLGGQFRWMSEMLKKKRGLLPGVTLFGFPYDWRQEPNADWMLDDLCAHIINAFVRSGGRKVDIICHSMGGLLMLFLWKKRHDFCLQYLRSITSIGTPYGGASAIATSSSLVGYTMQMDFLNHNSFRVLEMTAPVYFHLTPNPFMPTHEPASTWVKKRLPIQLSPAEIVKWKQTNSTTHYHGVEVLFNSQGHAILQPWVWVRICVQTDDSAGQQKRLSDKYSLNIDEMYLDDGQSDTVSVCSSHHVKDMIGFEDEDDDLSSFMEFMYKPTIMGEEEEFEEDEEEQEDVDSFSKSDDVTTKAAITIPRSPTTVGQTVKSNESYPSTVFEASTSPSNSDGDDEPRVGVGKRLSRSMSLRLHFTSSTSGSSKPHHPPTSVSSPSSSISKHFRSLSLGGSSARDVECTIGDLEEVAEELLASSSDLVTVDRSRG